jgi:hypothetical protein
MAILGAGWLGLALLVARAAEPVVPAGPKETTTPGGAVLKVCGNCHSMEVVADTPRDGDAWHDTVQAMIDRGARGTPAEFDLVMQYLYQNLTTIDVNHADADLLQTVLQASPEAAAAIIARRPFKDLADLEASVPGLDAKALDAKSGMIFFQ